MGALLALQIQISLTVLLALLLRFCMNRLPKLLSYGLWIIVFLRLLIPVSIESPLGILPQRAELERMWQQLTGTEIPDRPGRTEGEFPQEEETAASAGGQQGFISGENKDIPAGAHQQTSAEAANGKRQELQSSAKKEGSAAGQWPFGADAINSVGPQNFRWVPLAVWFTGLAVVLGYNILVMSRIRRQIRNAEKQEGKVYCCPGIDMPFTMGILHPRIYLPTGLESEKRACVLCHERVHIRRRDYLVKGVAFLLTAVYWYNPLVWVAFCMLEQDMEMSCDEAVVRSMGDQVRRAYSQSLLDFAAGGRSASIMPPAFGEHSVKQRVKNILTGKRNRWWGVLAGVFLLAAAILLIFCTSSEGESSADPPVSSPLLKRDSAVVWEQVAVKTFVYTGEPLFDMEDDPFIIAINEDGTFSYSESALISFLGFGTWEIQDGILVLTSNSGASFQNRFRIEGDELVFVKEGSSNFGYIKLQDGERFVPADVPERPDMKPSDQVAELSWECYEQIYDGKGAFYLNTRYGIYRKQAGPEGDIYTCLYPRYIGAPQSHSRYPRLTLHPNVDKLYFVTDSGFAEESLDWYDDCIMSLDLRTLETEIVAQDEGEGPPQSWLDQIDAFYGISPSKKERNQEWEEMTAYWGDDLLQQYELVRSLGMDVAETSGDETLEIYAIKADSELAAEYGAVVRVLDAQGEVLLTEVANLPGMGHNALYAGNQDGQDFLMNFYLEDRGTFGTYRYEVYRLAQDGSILQTAGSGFSWDYDEMLGEDALLYNDEVFREWAKELQEYMEASQLLMSTLEWELETDPAVRPYRYNYDSLTRGHTGEELKGRTDR